ncbi:AvaB protein [Verticillium alfalfae VaMs.102]|uniref:AvaB protein n=1 Tax=Verticillium alfalfae (strain VaMs.102 / ATCC MYA-4576 / FGSC 10136) TaxID=526221 RepID=C9SCX6_VERA1|nr:AvaB protein [Verticillium alfalfae VaMs.102]EEY16941.1 AvaB protein [Verticillium alfalfae VaMs.102]
MLSAFTARPIIELKQRDKSKIETILAYGDRILVGLNSGALRVYRLNELPPPEPNGSAHTNPLDGDDDASLTPQPPQPAPKPTDLLREVEKFSTRAIEQLAIIKEATTLVSLSNYYISLHNLQTYELIETLSRTKNASCFAVTSNIVKDPDTGIPEIISRLAVAVRRRLLPGIQRLRGAGEPLRRCQQRWNGVHGPGRLHAQALGAKLAEGEMLLAKDINTLFITDEGKPVEKRQIPWQAAPDSIGYSYPYIVALQPPAKGSLEVRNPDTLSLLQTLALPGAAQLHFPPPNLSLAHAGKGFHISSERSVWKMDATDYDSQIDELVEKAKYDEAISILNMLEDALLKDKTETLREVSMLKAEAMFKQKKFRDSMDLFNEDHVPAPPERVLKLYPPAISGELSGWGQSRQDEAEEDKHDGDGSTKDTNGDSPSSENPPETAASPVKATGGFAKLFLGHRKAPASDTASIASKKLGTDVEDAPSIKGKSSDDLSLEEKDLADAVHALTGYLVGTRTRLQRVIDPVTTKLKRSDTNGSTEEAIKNLMPTSSDESDAQREGELQRTFRLVDTTLFRAYMYWRPQLAGSLFRIPNLCDPEVVNEKLLEHNRFTELVDFFYGKKLHSQALELLKRFGAAEKADEAAPTLHGPERTIAYLQNLPPHEIDLIIHYSEWTLKRDSEHAMEVFIADSENAETLPRDRVVTFLRRIDARLELQYLEHIIGELDDSTPDFHNRLVELYIQLLREGSSEGSQDDLMVRFVEFLRESKQYSLGKAYGLIPRDETTIRVHRRKRSRPSSPEDKDEDTPSIYHTLLSLYLTPPAPHKTALEPALDLLSKHGSRLPATSTMSLIPSTLPVSELESYFRGRIRSANSVVNESRIVAGLRATEYISSQALLLLGDGIPGGQGGRNRRVVITDERLCGVCHKRLGGSVVSVLPDNTVVHYGCLNRATAQKSDGQKAGSWGRMRSSTRDRPSVVGNGGEGTWQPTSPSTREREAPQGGGEGTYVFS